ncbi:MAG: zinc transporter ZntB [Coxiellaceae bacterium]|nr:zinc transporter ZntB [Coxiellaceae bacterium]
MSKDDALIAAYLLDGKGGGKEIGWPGIDSWDQSQGVLWTHLNYNQPESQDWLMTKSGLPHHIAHLMISPETRPRVLVTKRGILMTLRGVNLNPGHDPQDMVSIRVWIDKHRIISSRNRILLSVKDMKSAIDNKTGPTSPADFLLQLNDHLLSRIGNVINDLDSKVEKMDEAIDSTKSVRLRSKIADVRRQTVCIRRYLAPQREALYQLQLQNIDLFDKHQMIHLRESTDRIIRYVEDLDSARDRAAITQEELTSRISEQMDKRMYVLSVAAVIFLPLSFVTGLFGMNVGGIPGLNYKHGFFFVCLALLIFGVGMIFAFKKRRFM